MQRKGGYQTRQKAVILAYLETHPERHVTAAELLHALTENGTPMGVATIYRQLEKLEQEGLVRRYSLDDRGSACWQYGGEEAKAGTCHSHFHLKCTECGTLIHLDCDHLHEIAHHVASDHGFCIDPSRTVFYGICEACRKNAGSPDPETEPHHDCCCRHHKTE
ncbi:MAG: transcriptional repressor [Oscillospiraceae bacterium]|nr:transcriptional repressor [Oscillospiraceae bacterium]